LNALCGVDLTPNSKEHGWGQVGAAGADRGRGGIDLSQRLLAIVQYAIQSLYSKPERPTQ